MYSYYSYSGSSGVECDTGWRYTISVCDRVVFWGPLGVSHYTVGQSVTLGYWSLNYPVEG